MQEIHQSILTLTGRYL